MPRINVLVAATSFDLQAEVISAAVEQRPDMHLVAGRSVVLPEIETLLDGIPSAVPCALMLVGLHDDTEVPAAHWLERHRDLVVLRVDIVEDVVRIAAHDVGLNSLLAAVRALADYAGLPTQKRDRRFRMRQLATDSGSGAGQTDAHSRPLLNAGIDWLHAVLRAAAGRLIGDCESPSSHTVVTTAIADLLDSRAARTARSVCAEVEAADVAFSRMVEVVEHTSEPLAVTARSLGVSLLELRLMLMAWAPELDPRYQRWIGLLLDDLGRRVGTLGLYAELLGEPTQIRCELASTGNLARWRVFEGSLGGMPASDEPLRLDPFLCNWLLGHRNALESDPRVRRALRFADWPGADLLTRGRDRDLASALIDKLQTPDEMAWVLLSGNDTAGWRALIELGAGALQLSPIRVDVALLAGLDIGEVQESGVRLARMARLTGQPLIVDATGGEGAIKDESWLPVFLSAIGTTGRPTAIISTATSRLLGLLGSASYHIEDAAPLEYARVTVLRAAATGAGACLSEETAGAIASRYPLRIDGFERAMRLARTRPLISDGNDPRNERFVAACKEVAADNISSMAERVEPLFKLEDVVLPADRKQQLEELVDNVRFASKVLDGWDFRAQLPYGHGVTALFHGPSGTGKTMAALGVARKLGIQTLRIDLSRVVSKYIGETEKNIDRVFADAQMCGAAVVVDEADAFLGRRSEGSDGLDRYANIEVAYLLQRIETYEGLAILTTNLRQNVDPAFLRRLRFIIDFPKPDADAREKIWRRCLPQESHTLDDAAFRQLARRIDLTGGHVRQITLRAAFIAAAAGSRINLDHVARAARAEFLKLGLPPIAVDVTEGRRAA